MYAQSTLSEYQREQLVDLFEQGYGRMSAASKIKVGAKAAERLYERWKLHGKLCLMEKPTKTQYSYETKKEVVDRYRAGETAMELAAEFNLSSANLVKNWGLAWRKGGDEALMPKPKGRPKGSASKPPLSEEEKLRLENKRLLAKVAYLEKLRDLRDQGHR
ncbi:helix-turn-helix domain-containing protein [Glutamicibacter sp. JC586]|uniref:helix-turn-helix domain-containing protein n=1 Tax=Glutamicibacter sp. JC586 TaxID=2590552 RepID=UPI00190F64AA|nr:helix-turn-helix domain-containing protein [Glutamicibacter sp. JC586]